MKTRHLFALAYASVLAVSTAASALTGAGSTFAEPLYKRWGEQYAQQDSAKGSLNYDGVGSGEGLARILARKVDFGASDEPLKRNELDEKGLRQFPVAMGAIVPVVNLPGVPHGQLKLSAEVLAKIYMGKIRRWNDPEIANLNDGLPRNALDVAIKPIFRADGSGSTFVLTYYLAAQSPDWQHGPGVGKDMKGAVGTAAKGTGGIVDAVRSTTGAIGYVDYGRAVKDKLNIVQMPNRVGVYVQANNDSIQAAAKFDAEKIIYNADPDFYLVLANNDTYAGWPLATATFAVVPRGGKDAQRVLEFLYWAMRNGDAAARELGYVPLSETMKVGIRKAWARQYGYKPGL